MREEYGRMPTFAHSRVFDETTGWKLSIRKTEDAVTARADVPAASRWFEGHFPGDPILPGIAQLALVIEVLKRALGPKTAAVRFSRVRFKQLIRPGDRLALDIRPKPEDARRFAFRITCGTEPALAGSVTVSGEDEQRHTTEEEEDLHHG